MGGHTKSRQDAVRSTAQALQTVTSRQDLVRCSSQVNMNLLGYNKDVFGQSIAVQKLCAVKQDFAQQGIKLLYCLSPPA